MIKRATAVLTRALLVAMCALGCGGSASGDSSPNPLVAEEAPHETSDVMRAYQEIIEIRQAMLEETEQLLRSGRSESTKLSQDKINLSEAHLQSAMAKGQQNEVTRELRAILSTQQEIHDTLKRRQKSGHVTEHSLNEARIAVLNAAIRLNRVDR